MNFYLVQSSSRFAAQEAAENRVGAAANDIANAIEMQLLEDVGDAWGKYGHVFAVEKPSDVPADGIPILLLDSPDQPDALGDHFEQLGKYVGQIFIGPILDAGGDLMTNPAVCVSSVISHEILETLCDPTANLWGQRGNGDFIALEIADPVEGDSYTKTRADGAVVQVSNFVLPAWFDAQNAFGPFDHLTKLNAPFTMTPGGYLIVCKGGDVTQEFGEHRTAHPAWKVPTRSKRRVGRR